MTEEEQREVISSLGINQVFEGIGNIINIIGKVTEEGGVSQENPVRRSHDPANGGRRA